MIKWKDYEKKGVSVNPITRIREDLVVEKGSMGYEDSIDKKVRVHYEVYNRVGSPLYQIKCWVPAMGVQVLSAYAQMESLSQAKQLAELNARERLNKLIRVSSSITPGRIP